MTTVIKAENISKQYRLGYVGSGSIKDDVKRWWYGIRGKEDPLLTVGESNDRTRKGESDYVWALKDINFEIQQGDTVGIIGRNGAGKSTLLKLLSKVTAPTTGNIKVKGRIASLLEVGTGFHGELTGRENIYLNGAIMGMRKHEITRRLDEIVDFAGVERYLDTPVKRYSSGMYVRLGFAVAAHLDNEILIVDEVLAVGDAEFQKKCLGKMGDVAKGEGRTVLFVSHNMAAVKSLCHKGIYLKNGKIKAHDNILNILSCYQADFSYEQSIKIQDRKDRIGSGIFQFSEVIFFNNNFEKQDVYYSDEELIIGLKYRIINNTPLKNVNIGVAINNSYDLQITNLSNESSNGNFELLPDNRLIICRIKKLQLVSGIYSLNLFCKVNNEISDWIINTCQLKVEKSDYYGTGHNQDVEQSLFLLDYEFKIK
jgi:lipopolysaccharide transport system ATP-binding protein